MPTSSDYSQFIESLAFSGSASRKSLITQAFPGTCDWILSEQNFRLWESATTEILWIQGKPGSGKSTIIKYLYNHFEKKNLPLPEVSAVNVSTFFNTRGSPMEKSMDGFLRSTITQILEQLPGLFRHITDKYISAEKTFSVPELKDLLFTLYERWTHKAGLILLIDALDELEDPVRDLVALLEGMIKIADERYQCLRICVPGRPVHRVAPWLRQYLCVVLENHTSRDIEYYVQAKTLRIITDRDARSYRDFQQDVIDKAKGVFLWVVLVIEELLDGWESSDPIRRLQKKLASLPAGVEELFGRMLQKIAPDNITEATKMFQCVLGAVEPLNLAEFRCALAFGSESSCASITEMNESEMSKHTDTGLERRIQKCCGGLIEVSKPSLTVQVIHQTVLDYLRPSPHHEYLNRMKMDLTLPKCHQYLLRACIEYLCAPELKDIPITVNLFIETYQGQSRDEIFQKFHFLSYSLKNWLDHYFFAERDGSSQSLYIQKLAESSHDHFLMWYKLYCHCFGGGWDGLSPSFLSFAAEQNMYGYVKDRLERSTAKSIENIDGSEFGGPVQAAVVGNNQAMVRLLLDHGLDVNAVGGRFGTAIAAAITFQNRDMVDLLQEYGARVDIHSPGSPVLPGVPGVSGSSGWFSYRNAFSRARATMSHHIEPRLPADRDSEPPSSTEEDHLHNEADLAVERGQSHDDYKLFNPDFGSRQDINDQS